MSSIYGAGSNNQAVEPPSSPQNHSNRTSVAFDNELGAGKSVHVASTSSLANGLVNQLESSSAGNSVGHGGSNRGGSNRGGHVSGGSNRGGSNRGGHVSGGSNRGGSNRGGQVSRG
jgi:hypothetical protein